MEVRADYISLDEPLPEGTLLGDPETDQPPVDSCTRGGKIVVSEEPSPNKTPECDDWKEGLQTDNVRCMADFRGDLDNKLAQADSSYKVEHDLKRCETNILKVGTVVQVPPHPWPPPKDFAREIMTENKLELSCAKLPTS